MQKKVRVENPDLYLQMRDRALKEPELTSYQHGQKTISDKHENYLALRAMLIQDTSIPSLKGKSSAELKGKETLEIPDAVKEEVRNHVWKLWGNPNKFRAKRKQPGSKEPGRFI